MKIANFLMAGATALLLASCGGSGMSFDEAKDIRFATKKGGMSKLTSEQKKAVIENSIYVLNEKEYEENFEEEFIKYMTVPTSIAEAWAEEDAELKDLVNDLKKAEQEKDKRKEAYDKAKEEWEKENGLDK